jgi:tetratricopeptide (TPR) repeat protein
MQRRSMRALSRVKPPVLFLILLTAILVPACGRQKETGNPSELTAQGWNQYTLGEFDLAIRKFESAAASAEPASDAQLKALYGLATTWNLRRPGEDPKTAVALYQRIIDDAPEHDLAAWSLLALARMKHLVPVGEDPDYREVRPAYQKVIDHYPHHLAAKEAFIYLNATLVASLDVREARQALTNLDAFVKNPSNEFLGPAYSLMAVASTTLGDQDRRLWAEIQSLEKTEVDPTNPFTEFAWQYWNIATIAEFEVGDFETAKKYYRKMIDEYPTDIRVYAAEQALKRMDELEARIRNGL